MPSINLQISIFITYHVWLDKELLVLPIFMYFYLRQLLQFSWRFWFSSLALSDLMKSQCFSWSWSDFTLDSLFQFSWGFQLSSLAMSHLMRNWWFYQSFDVFTSDSPFNSPEGINFYHMPSLSQWKIVGSLWLNNWLLTTSAIFLLYFLTLSWFLSK